MLPANFSSAVGGCHVSGSTYVLARLRDRPPPLVHPGHQFSLVIDDQAWTMSPSVIHHRDVSAQN